MMPFVVRTSGVLAAAALAFSLTFGGVARAEELQTVFLEGQEMALVPVKSIEALEKRIAYLEETVNSLTEAWQHIDRHRLCISDANGEAETCLTKSQLDVLLPAPTPTPAPVPEAHASEVGSAATVEPTEPAAAVVASEARTEEPEHASSTTPAAPAEAQAQPPAETAPND